MAKVSGSRNQQEAAKRAAETARKKAFEELTVKGRKEAEKISVLLNKTKQHELLARHDVGVKINSMMNDEDVYGKRIIPNLSIITNYAETALYTAKKMANFWTREEMVDISERKNSKGQTISYKHIECVCQLDNDKLRERLLDAILEHSLTSREVADMVKESTGGKSSSGGRKPQPPRTPTQGLQQIIKRAADFNKRYEDVWVEHVFEAIDAMPSDDYDDDLFVALQEAKQAIDDLRGTVAIADKVLSEHIGKVGNVVKEDTSIRAEDDSEDEDDDISQPLASDEEDEDEEDEEYEEDEDDEDDYDYEKVGLKKASTSVS